jgi:hypothetical protein
MVKALPDAKLVTIYNNLSQVNLNSAQLKNYKEFFTYFRDLSSYELLLRSEN